MEDYFDEFKSMGVNSYFGGLPGFLRAALIFSIPFIVIDFFNYYSAGISLLISCPLLIIIYLGCGFLSAKLSKSYLGHVEGAKAGVTLWALSTLINVIISLILGTFSLGATLFLGIPYLCLCVPFQFFMGGLIGALGGVINNSFSRRSYEFEEYY